MTHRNPKWPDACASRDPGLNCVRRDSERESAPREERKVVSVFFADLVDFTATAEQLDPEDIRGFLMPYYAHVRSELEGFGGTVEKFIGSSSATRSWPSSARRSRTKTIPSALVLRGKCVGARRR